MKIIDHVLAWLIDKVTACLGSFWPPTGTIYDSDSWVDAYRFGDPRREVGLVQQDDPPLPSTGGISDDWLVDPPARRWEFTYDNNTQNRQQP